MTLLQPLAAALGLRVDDLLTCRAAEKEEPLEPDITPTPEPAAPESTAPEAASPAVQAVLDISQESLWQRKRQLIQRIAAGVILLAVLVFAALGVFLIYTQRIGETYNIIERSHSPADQAISIEAYPASLFNDDKTLIRMWRGRYYLADSGSDRTYVSFPLDENEEFGFLTGPVTAPMFLFRSTAVTRRSTDTICGMCGSSKRPVWPPLIRIWGPASVSCCPRAGCCPRAATPMKSAWILSALHTTTAICMWICVMYRWTARSRHTCALHTTSPPTRWWNSRHDEKPSGCAGGLSPHKNHHPDGW